MSEARLNPHYINEMADIIKSRRIELGMTQTQLGDAIGVSFQQIQKYEKGQNQVASSMVPDLCVALKITPNDLYRWGTLFQLMKNPAGIPSLEDMFKDI